MIDYPKGWPVPLIEGFRIDVDAGVQRSIIDTGYYRQSNEYYWQPETYSVDFVVPAQDFGDWQDWMNEFSGQWFRIDMMSHMSSKDGRTEHFCTPHIVRLIDDLMVTPFMGQQQQIKVSTKLELAPRSPD